MTTDTALREWFEVVWAAMYQNRHGMYPLTREIDNAFDDYKICAANLAQQPVAAVDEYSEVADALEKCQWENVTIGNKVIISCAINALRKKQPDTSRDEKDWQPIETAPKYGHIDIWIPDKDGVNGRRWSYCYYDEICDEWRTTANSGQLLTIKARSVSHWMPVPRSPNSQKKGQSNV